MVFNNIRVSRTHPKCTEPACRCLQPCGFSRSNCHSSSRWPGRPWPGLKPWGLPRSWDSVPFFESRAAAGCVFGVGTDSQEGLRLRSSLPRSICRNVSEDFCCIHFGGFSRGFSWRIFLWALFPTKMERKNPARKSAKKSGGSKIIKIREKSVLPKAGPDGSRAQKPPSPALRKNYENRYQIHHSRVGPPKNEKRKTKKCEEKRIFLGHFRICSVFLPIFGARPGVRNFFFFPGLKGFELYTRIGKSQKKVLKTGSTTPTPQLTKMWPQNTPPPCRNDYINNSLRVILCNDQDLIT